MNVKLVRQYLEDRYGSLSMVKREDSYKLDDLFIYEISKKKLVWYVNVESDLVSWFGPGNYNTIINEWFIERFLKENGDDK